MPGFTIAYMPDSRQAIAATWPRAWTTAQAAKDWGWKARIGLDEMVDDMLTQLAPLVKAKATA